MEDNGLVGSMVFYMLLRAKTMIDPNISISLSGSCQPGWKETLHKCGYKYTKAVMPDTNGLVWSFELVERASHQKIKVTKRFHLPTIDELLVQCLKSVVQGKWVY